MIVKYVWSTKKTCRNIFDIKGLILATGLAIGLAGFFQGLSPYTSNAPKVAFITNQEN